MHPQQLPHLVGAIPPELPKLIAACAFFGLIAVFPLVMLFLRHQRMMAEMLHGRAANETLQRLEAIERELRELKAANHERILRDDDTRELGKRVTHDRA